MDPLRARALDVGLEDGGIRSPLNGLFPKGLPVPSLTTALEAIGKRYSNLGPEGTSVKLARRHLKKIDAVHTRGMSEDEVIALILYTMEAVPREESLYYMMNAALRGKDRGGVSEWRDFIWLLLHAMRKIEKPTERSVYRGVKVESGMFGSSRPNLATGLDVTWSGFSSTASTINVMNAFLGQDGERIMYDIELTEPLARDIKPFSLFPSENELLLPPNFSYEIVSTFEAGGGLTMVQCKQTETLDVLLDFGAPPSTWNVPTSRPAQTGVPPQAQAQSAQQAEQIRMMQQIQEQMQQMQQQQQPAQPQGMGPSQMQQVQQRVIPASELAGEWTRPPFDSMGPNIKYSIEAYRWGTVDENKLVMRTVAPDCCGMPCIGAPLEADRDNAGADTFTSAKDASGLIYTLEFIDKNTARMGRPSWNRIPVAFTRVANSPNNGSPTPQTMARS